MVIIRRLVLWTPRILGLLIALFTGIFSLDVFGTGLPAGQAILAFFIHLLVPTLLLLTAVLQAWRRPLAGGVIFLGWAAFYAAMSGDFSVSAVLLIAGIPALVGFLYLIDWGLSRRAGKPFDSARRMP